MPILFNCKCGKPLKARDELTGKKIKCPHCGNLLTVPSGSLATTRTSEPAAKETGTLLEGAISIEEGPLDEAARIATSTPTLGEASVPVADSAPVDDSEKKYKVVTTKDLGFVSKFDSARLEDALNQYWKKGWAVRSTVRISVQSHGGAHDELVFILER